MFPLNNFHNSTPPQLKHQFNISRPSHMATFQSYSPRDWGSQKSKIIFTFAMQEYLFWRGCLYKIKTLPEGSKLKLKNQLAIYNLMEIRCSVSSELF